MAARQLIFIRHGETDWNREGRLQGQRETAINARGLVQAAASAAVLGRWLGAGRDAFFADARLFASPIERARQTMDVILTELARPPGGYATCPELKEIAFGAWEGLTWTEVKALDPAAYRARRAAEWDFVPPGGESYAMLADRVAVWLRPLEGDILAVAHGGVGRVLMHLMAGVAPEAACDAEIDQGRALLFEDAGFRWLGAAFDQGAAEP